MLPDVRGADAETRPPPLRLKDSPALRDEWSRQAPAPSLFYHHDVVAHLVWCAAVRRSLTGGTDGEAKILKAELSHARSAPASTDRSSMGGAAPTSHPDTCGSRDEDVRYGQRGRKLRSGCGGRHGRNADVAPGQHGRNSADAKRRATHGSGSSTANGAKAMITAHAVQLTCPVVTDAYLSPALAHIKAAARRPSRGTRGSLSSLPSSSSTVLSQLSWYAMRQHKHDVAQEKARLWNTPRVMRTLMGWSGTATATDDTFAGTALQVSALASNATEKAGAVVQRVNSPGLALPDILTSHPPPLLHGAAGATCSPTLPALLYVPPTAAVDAAVHQGLPSRATLQRELAAMRAKIRQSVQQRTAQQRLLRTAATSKNVLADGTSEKDEEGSEHDGDDLASATQATPMLSPEVAAAPAPTHERSATKFLRLSVSTETTAAATSPSSRHRPTVKKQH